VTFQVTPAFWGSLLTVTARLVLLSMRTELGGVCVKVTEMGEALMVILAETVALLLLADVAVTVTVPPEGTLVGAVYVVGTPLAICAEEKLPHWALPHVTVQLTRAFCGPLVTIAAMGAVLPGAPVVSDDGGAFGAAANAMVIGGGVELLLPQAASSAAKEATTKRRATRREFTGRLL